MKAERCIAFAVVTMFPLGVAAQGNVVIYGIADGGVEITRTTPGAAGPGATLRSAVTGSYSASRLGLRGTEDLGGGLRAGFLIEHGFDLDTGTTTGAKLWGRDSYVSIAGPWGEMRLGYTYTPAFYVILAADNNRFGLYGNGGSYTQIGASGNLRTTNGINYISPSFGGVMARATYSLGVESAVRPKDAGRMAAASVEYRAERVYAGAFHHVRKDVFPAGSGTSASAKYSGAGANVLVGPVRVGGGIARFDPAGPRTVTAGPSTGWWMGVQTTAGLLTVGLQVGQIKSEVASGVEPKANLASLSAMYALSKRTTLYASAGSMKNNEASRQPLLASSRAIPLPGGQGADAAGLVLGARHTF